MSEKIEVRFTDTDRERLILHLLPGDDPEPYTGMSLRVRVEVRIASFTADVEHYVFAKELLEFQNELETLYNTLNGTASLTTIGEWLTIEAVVRWKNWNTQ
jgi:hypothetical protein